MKFGGTSVADLERIRRVARLVAAEAEAGKQVTVVVSAMAGKTNELVAWTDGAGTAAQGIPESDDEYDVVVASGEQVTAGLLAMTLRNMGHRARSWLGWQIPVRTNATHSAARIEAIDCSEIIKRFTEGQVAVCAGFQGLGTDNRITTLGRGGSDTSAVALAAALEADRCDIYTDVDGIYTADPRIATKAAKLDKITYEEMLELASLGAKVLQTRSVEMAMKYRVKLQVLSSFDDLPGTLVVDEEDIVEHQVVSGVTYTRDEAKITLQQVADRPGVAALVFGALADANVNVDMIVQNVSEDGKATDLTFTVGRKQIDQALAVLETLKDKVSCKAIVPDANVVKVSIVGMGMRSHAGVAKKMFAALAEKNINIQVISTSEIKVSVLIAEEYTELAVRTLHTAFGLDAA